ncbi:MAG: LysM peptidoglycan-binding domain-containing protein, partial [Anaerolineales bacterium]
MLLKRSVITDLRVVLLLVAAAAALAGCSLWSGPQITPFVTTGPESTWAPAAIETAVTAVPTLASTEAPTPFLATPTAPETCQYRVDTGNTLWEIANEFGTSVAEIASESGISNPDLLQVGQILSIPGGYREGCLTELVTVDSPRGDPSDGVADFSRAPIANPSPSGWNYGEDENAGDYERSGCKPWRSADQPCLHPGYDIYSSDYTVRANASGVVKYYQTYAYIALDGSTTIRTVEYDPDDPVANEDLEWFGNYAVLET